MALALKNEVTTRERLREILPRGTGNASRKDLDHINAVGRAFIARCPYVLVSTVGADGRHDISPKGDAPGFVEVVDDQTLIIPDRLGNHRLDSFENLLVNPGLGLIFLIPGNKETLRVSGTGRIAADADLCARHAVNGRSPDLVLVVTVEQAFMHCSMSSVRSRLWAPDLWPDTGDVPLMSEWVKAAVDTEQTLDEVQAIHDRDAATRLY
ncbi:pyridoxamine 5'-phosphate oxidase [Antarctobacter heliothermus]|uniref:Pyridoxamine 5'-phosphate oxidase n=1 Tax=Antarctobacter heliothermus TaxID=74033 RepID=A0A222DZP3_9RHOB|nr:MSMEG_1061 family FMN-dependent PPOX-type flavoprotein [Antarctobacter heliothermus]ASP19444.1 pyridoxamine 5'-phosphate oxidase [Antarctobacter heliothermus]